MRSVLTVFQDINDNTPQFDKSEYISAVPENVRIGMDISMLCIHIYLYFVLLNFNLKYFIIIISHEIIKYS